MCKRDLTLLERGEEIDDEMFVVSREELGKTRFLSDGIIIDGKRYTYKGWYILESALRLNFFKECDEEVWIAGIAYPSDKVTVATAEDYKNSRTFEETFENALEEHVEMRRRILKGETSDYVIPEKALANFVAEIDDGFIFAMKRGVDIQDKDALFANIRSHLSFSWVRAIFGDLRADNVIRHFIDVETKMFKKA